ncbi:hypothetical protein [Sinomonas sp. ASV322]|uniref:hypothetical protein n=1 Tax=Sinomonas sp. ASV322 TaxID=3041920 RepID=UPI0027DD3DD1|nr:hypothetical protein [Sinomonas sp. ASV322]MDQ4500746.1 hypothetical protein [Sinomonas sp. ASV322]
MEHGINALTKSLEALGATPVLRHGLLTYTVIPTHGARAGQMVETGIAEAEAQVWPATPPHWVHIPAEVTIPGSNTQPSPHPGWLGHSRDIQGWANEVNHAVAWLSHVRSVMAGAIS